MKSRCALCGRPTLPAVLIGNHPVGPTCARRAGLLNLASRKSGLVFPVTGHRRTPRGPDPVTRDLFEDMPV